MNFKQLLAFTIFVHERYGIVFTAPSSLLNAYELFTKTENPRQPLNQTERRTFDRYIEIWRVGKE